MLPSRSPQLRFETEGKGRKNPLACAPGRRRALHSGIIAPSAHVEGKRGMGKREEEGERASLPPAAAREKVVGRLGSGRKGRVGEGGQPREGGNRRKKNGWWFNHLHISNLNLNVAWVPGEKCALLNLACVQRGKMREGKRIALVAKIKFDINDNSGGILFSTYYWSKNLVIYFFEKWGVVLKEKSQIRRVAKSCVASSN